VYLAVNGTTAIITITHAVAVVSGHFTGHYRHSSLLVVERAVLKWTTASLVVNSLETEYERTSKTSPT